jgi:ABC-type nickel/cobalt efflux system permease component RcnA
LRFTGAWIGVFLALAVLGCPDARAHDIPNQRVDRSSQATLLPGLLKIDYELSLSELTLTQDLRSLIGSIPGGDRSDWFKRYGEVTGPLNAKGFLISRDGEPVPLEVRGFDLVVEEHPRFTFHFQATVPQQGRLRIHDTNYVSSEGTCRLAIRGRGGVSVEGDELPSDVDQIPVRPVWQLTDEEERRTRSVEINFQGPSSASAQVETALRPASQARHRESSAKPDQLSRLLDRDSAGSWIGLLLIAAGLGAIHAIQPGHGKTLVSAIALGPDARWYQPALLGLVTTIAHTGSVLLIAATLWCTGASRVAGLHQSLVQAAGFAIAAGGFWRIGRYLGEWGEHSHEAEIEPGPLSLGSLIGLGIAGGLVPCWDAVALIVLSAALGRLGTGVLVVLAFGIGMAGVLVGVGLLASRLKAAVVHASRAKAWESRLGLASGAVLAVIGLAFFLGRAWE